MFCAEMEVLQVDYTFTDIAAGEQKRTVVYWLEHGR